MTESDFALDLDELSSAEDFLDYFEVTYDPAVVHVNRLHILQRFHDYLDAVEVMPDDDAGLQALYTEKLTKAYTDFVDSDAVTEKVFRVFHMHEPSVVQVKLADFKQQVVAGASEI